jgi:hypothetical protein
MAAAGRYSTACACGAGHSGHQLTDRRQRPAARETGDLTGIPNLLFTTPSALVRKKTVVKVMHDVTCAGDLPGAPAGTRVVSLAAVYDQAAGAGAVPAYFA